MSEKYNDWIETTDSLMPDSSMPLMTDGNVAYDKGCGNVAGKSIVKNILNKVKSKSIGGHTNTWNDKYNSYNERSLLWQALYDCRDVLFCYGLMFLIMIGFGLLTILSRAWW